MRNGKTEACAYGTEGGGFFLCLVLVPPWSCLLPNTISSSLSMRPQRHLTTQRHYLVIIFLLVIYTHTAINTSSASAASLVPSRF